MASHKSFKRSRTVTLPLAYQLVPISGGGSPSGTSAFNGSNLTNILNDSTANSLGLIDRQIAAQTGLANRQIQYQLYNKQLSDVLGATSIAANPQAIQPTNFGLPGQGGGAGGTFA